MNNPLVLEECFKRYIKNINDWLPEGIIEINLDKLYELNLLNFHRNKGIDPSLNRYFHVIESEEKLTLVNDQFIVWIVPEKNELKIPLTWTLIALNKNEEVKLELAFVTSGVYNNSQLVLKTLEKYLFDIQNTEEQLEKLKSHSSGF